MAGVHGPPRVFRWAGLTPRCVAPQCAFASEKLSAVVVSMGTDVFGEGRDWPGATPSFWQRLTASAVNLLRKALRNGNQ